VAQVNASAVRGSRGGLSALLLLLLLLLLLVVVVVQHQLRQHWPMLQAQPAAACACSALRSTLPAKRNKH
jgi:hypothetical protein